MRVQTELRVAVARERRNATKARTFGNGDYYPRDAALLLDSHQPQFSPIYIVNRIIIRLSWRFIRLIGARRNPKGRWRNATVGRIEIRLAGMFESYYTADTACKIIEQRGDARRQTFWKKVNRRAAQ